MPIEFTCPSCGAPQRAGDHLVGRTLRCYKCTNLFNVPAGSTLPPTPPAPEPAPLLPPGPAPVDGPSPAAGHGSRSAADPGGAGADGAVAGHGNAHADRAAGADGAVAGHGNAHADDRGSAAAEPAPAAAEAAPNLDEEFALPDGFSWEEEGEDRRRCRRCRASARAGIGPGRYLPGRRAGAAEEEKVGCLRFRVRSVTIRRLAGSRPA